MLFASVVAIIVSLALIIMVLKEPTIKIKGREVTTFWIFPLFGAITLLIFNVVPLNYVLNSFQSNTNMNPIKILVLFISISLLSISLDELGFFKYLANAALKHFNKNQFSLFFVLYGLIAILTMFTSNDIIILTFTPFICHFAKNAKINPIPYLVMEFIVANTYSMTFSIGNPTNIYLSQSFNISFLEYFKKMALPSLFAGITSLFVILFLFKNDLRAPINTSYDLDIKIKNKKMMVINLVHLIVTTILLVISNYIHIEMWLICLISASSLTIFLTISSIIHKDNSLLKNTYKHLPYNLIPFVLSMFLIVLALDYTGVSLYVASFINNFCNTKASTTITYLIVSTLSDNLINNIPMSVFFSSILSSGGTYQMSAIYATIAGSNIGAYLTPIGALAGIMWMSLLKKQNVQYRFIDFVKYGSIIVPFVLLATFLGLFIAI